LSEKCFCQRKTEFGFRTLQNRLCLVWFVIFPRFCMPRPPLYLFDYVITLTLCGVCGQADYFGFRIDWWSPFLSSDRFSWFLTVSRRSLFEVYFFWEKGCVGLCQFEIIFWKLLYGSKISWKLQEKNWFFVIRSQFCCNGSFSIFTKEPLERNWDDNLPWNFGAVQQFSEYNLELTESKAAPVNTDTRTKRFPTPLPPPGGCVTLGAQVESVTHAKNQLASRSRWDPPVHPTHTQSCTWRNLRDPPNETFFKTFNSWKYSELFDFFDGSGRDWVRWLVVNRTHCQFIFGECVRSRLSTPSKKLGPWNASGSLEAGAYRTSHFFWGGG